MHPARLRCENSKYREYSCVFAPGRAGAYTPNSGQKGTVCAALPDDWLTRSRGLFSW